MVALNIKCIGINNLSNKYNGTPFGIMKSTWNQTLIINFGTMILYNALRMCVNERPVEVF